MDLRADRAQAAGREHVPEAPSARAEVDRYVSPDPRNVRVVIRGGPQVALTMVVRPCGGWCCRMGIVCLRHGARRQHELKVCDMAGLGRRAARTGVGSVVKMRRVGARRRHALKVCNMAGLGRRAGRTARSSVATMRRAPAARAFAAGWRRAARGVRSVS